MSALRRALTVLPLPRAVAGWGEADQERFFELAGTYLADGEDPHVADQRAMLEIIRARRARGEA